MQEHRFVRPLGPLGPYAEDYRCRLVGLGYTFGSLQHRMTQLSQVSRWLAAEGLAAADLDEEVALRFLAWRSGRGRKRWVSLGSIRLLLEFLRAAGVVEEAGGDGGPFGDVLGGYRRYLVEERGLADKTVAGHLREAEEFLVVAAGERSALAGLGGAQVRSYLVEVSRRKSTDCVQKAAGSVVSLLRYLHVSGVIDASLVWAVPKVASRRARPQSPGLSATEMAVLLSGCDRRRAVGRRDYAVLLLLGEMGLRACEVARLGLDDFDWRNGEVVVHGKGGRLDAMPVPARVGAAVAAYLRRDRPVLGGCRAVFLRSRAPLAPLGLAGVQAVVRDASRRAGMGMFGPRRLRHSAATRIHRGGTGLAVVAEVLRHRDIRVTAVYVDVDPAAVAELARPWPGARS